MYKTKKKSGQKLEVITVMRVDVTTLLVNPKFNRGHAVAQLVEALCYKRVRFPMVSLEFFIDINLRAALWAWG
jgi:hypothetical protein